MSAADVTRAADLADGKRVRYAGRDWHVWAKNGPRAGTCWLLRHDDDGKAVTVAAPIREIIVRRVESR